MRLHEVTICIIALVLPMAAVAAFQNWQAPLMALGISLALIGALGWVIDRG